MDEWEQMEMESPCVRCIWKNNEVVCSMADGKIENCVYWLKFNTKEETNEVP